MAWGLGGMLWVVLAAAPPARVGGADSAEAPRPAAAADDAGVGRSSGEAEQSDRAEPAPLEVAGEPGDQDGSDRGLRSGEEAPGGRDGPEDEGAQDEGADDEGADHAHAQAAGEAGGRGAPAGEGGRGEGSGHEWSSSDTSHSRSHALGVRGDTLGGSTGYGISYFHEWLNLSGRGGLGVMSWSTIGPGLRLFTLEHRQVDGVAGGVTARGGMMGDAGLPIGVEGYLGGGYDRDGFVGLVGGGIFVSARYFDIGLSGTAHVGAPRPEWLPGASLMVRVVIPLYTYFEAHEVFVDEVREAPEPAAEDGWQPPEAQ